MKHFNIMEKKSLYKGLGILAVTILLFTLISHRCSGGQTLSEYAAQNAVQAESQSDSMP